MPDRCQPRFVEPIPKTSPRQAAMQYQAADGPSDACKAVRRSSATYRALADTIAPTEHCAAVRCEASCRSFRMRTVQSASELYMEFRHCAALLVGKPPITFTTLINYFLI